MMVREAFNEREIFDQRPSEPGELHRGTHSRQKAREQGQKLRGRSVLEC